MFVETVETVLSSYSAMLVRSFISIIYIYIYVCIYIYVYVYVCMYIYIYSLMIFVPWHSDAKTSQYQNVFACDRQCEGRWLLTRLLASTCTGHCMTLYDAP